MQTLMMDKNTMSPGSFTDDEAGDQGRLLPLFQHCDNHAGSSCSKANSGHLFFGSWAECPKPHFYTGGEALTTDLVAEKDRVWVE